MENGKPNGHANGGPPAEADADGTKCTFLPLEQGEMKPAKSSVLEVFKKVNPRTGNIK